MWCKNVTFAYSRRQIPANQLVLVMNSKLSHRFTLCPLDSVGDCSAEETKINPAKRAFVKESQLECPEGFEHGLISDVSTWSSHLSLISRNCLARPSTSNPSRSSNFPLR